MSWMPNGEVGDAGGKVGLPAGLTRGSPSARRRRRDLPLGLDPRIAANTASHTGHYLKQVLTRRPSSKVKRAETQAASGAR